MCTTWSFFSVWQLPRWNVHRSHTYAVPHSHSYQPIRRCVSFIPRVDPLRRGKRVFNLPHAIHCGPDQPKTQTKVLGHSLVRSLVRSHCSLVYMLHPACFARANCCAHLLACSICSLSRLWESERSDSYFSLFFSVLDHSELRRFLFLNCGLPLTVIWHIEAKRD